MNIDDKELEFPPALVEIRPHYIKRVKWSHIGATIAVIIFIMISYSARDRTLSVENLMAVVLFVLFISMVAHYFKTKSLEKSSKQKEISNEDYRRLQLAKIQNRIAAEIIGNYMQSKQTITYQDIEVLKEQVRIALAQHTS